MIIRAGLASLFVSFLVCIVARAQVESLPSATDAYGGFAFPDRSGNRLLQLSDSQGMTRNGMANGLARPELLKTALCGASHLPVQFARQQVAVGGNNGRETSDNFDNLAGHVFDVARGTIPPDEMCFLVSESLLIGATALRIVAPEGAGACVQRALWGKIRGRSVAHCWPLARLGPGKNIALLEFERLDKDALASIVVVDGTRATFADYPAEFRGEGQDLWRVDDGGVLSPKDFKIVCAVQHGSWYALGIGWSGAEGQSLALWISEANGKFKKVVQDYWYQAPI